MITWDYIAGFFDGEGCVRQFNNHGKYFRVDITLTQAGERGRLLLEEIREFLADAGISTGKKLYFTPAAQNRKEKFDLKITKTASAKQFLTNVLPLLHIKQKEAASLLAALQERYT